MKTLIQVIYILPILINYANEALFSTLSLLLINYANEALFILLLINYANEALFRTLSLLLINYANEALFSLLLINYANEALFSTLSLLLINYANEALFSLLLINYANEALFSLLINYANEVLFRAFSLLLINYANEASDLDPVLECAVLHLMSYLLVQFVAVLLLLHQLVHHLESVHFLQLQRPLVLPVRYLPVEGLPLPGALLVEVRHYRFLFLFVFRHQFLHLRLGEFLTVDEHVSLKFGFVGI